MNKIVIIFAVIVLLVIVVLGVILIFDTQNNSQVLPGPTKTGCSVTIDCAGECGNDPCFVASCTKNGDSDSGTCVCLQICDE